MPPYTSEQAERDRQEFERMAAEADARGDEITAGLYRVEAFNAPRRVGAKKAHVNNLGPYSPSNPQYCIDCGLSWNQINEDEECVPCDA